MLRPLPNRLTLLVLCLSQLVPSQTASANSLLELQHSISEQEKRAGRVILEAGKRFFFVNPESPRKTKISLVFVHGFSASSAELSPFPEILAQHMEANLFLTRLSGHGIKGGDFTGVRYEDWAQDLEEARRIGLAIGDSVVFLGSSTGSTLIADALIRNRLGIRAVVLASGNFGVAAWGAEWLTVPILGDLLRRVLVGKYRSFEPHSPRMEKYWTTRYRSEAVTEVMRTVQITRSHRLEEIKVPALFLYSRHDRVLNLTETRKAYDRWGAKEKQYIEIRSAERHVLAGSAAESNGTEETLRITESFLKRLGLN